MSTERNENETTGNLAGRGAVIMGGANGIDRIVAADSSLGAFLPRFGKLPAASSTGIPPPGGGTPRGATTPRLWARGAPTRRAGTEWARATTGRRGPVRRERSRGQGRVPVLRGQRRRGLNRGDRAQRGAPGRWGRTGPDGVASHPHLSEGSRALEARAPSRRSAHRQDGAIHGPAEVIAARGRYEPSPSRRE